MPELREGAFIPKHIPKQELACVARCHAGAKRCPALAMVSFALLSVLFIGAALWVLVWATLHQAVPLMT